MTTEKKKKKNSQKTNKRYRLDSKVPAMDERIVGLSGATVGLSGGAFIQSCSLHSITIDIREVGRDQSLSHSVAVGLRADRRHKVAGHGVLVSLGSGHSIQVHGARAAVHIEAAAVVDRRRGGGVALLGIGGVHHAKIGGEWGIRRD
jgi:hypothetical protein